MRKRASGIYIRDQERELFRFLFESKVASSHHIQNKIYPDISHQALYKRLNLLILYGYLRANYHRELGGRLIYSLSEKGFKDFVQEWVSNIQIKQLRSQAPLHDLVLVEIRMAFNNMDEVESYFTENVLISNLEMDKEEALKSVRRVRPDAALRIDRDGVQYWMCLEFENQLKYDSRYKELFSRYLVISGVAGVLFISKDEQLQKKVMAKEKKFLGEKAGFFYYQTLQNVLHENTECIFTSVDEYSVIFKRGPKDQLDEVASTGCKSVMTCNLVLNRIDSAT